MYCWRRDQWVLPGAWRGPSISVSTQDASLSHGHPAPTGGEPDLSSSNGDSTAAKLWHTLLTQELSPVCSPAGCVGAEQRGGEGGICLPISAPHSQPGEEEIQNLKVQKGREKK